MSRPRTETALHRVSALIPLLLILGNGVNVRSQTVIGVNNCEDLKSTIESAGTSDERLIVQVQEGNSQIVCREGIYVALGQSIRVEGVSNRDVPTEFFLDAEGIFESFGDGSAVGILFDNDGDLELYNLAFLLDYVLPEDETTTATTVDAIDSTFGVRVVQNSGAVNITDCRIAGSRSMANQAYVLGQAVSSAADSASVFVSGLTYDNLSPSGSVIRAIGVSEVTIEYSSFYSGSDFAPSSGFGQEGSIIYCTSDVELIVIGSTFQSRPESIAGGASISSVGGTVTDCRFIGQYASQVGGGTVYSAFDSSSDRPLVIESSVFEGNIAYTSSSCIAVRDRNMTIRSSQFTGNEGTPVLFESSSSIGEHQLVVEDTDFTGNYETTEGELGGYNGGSAVVVRSTGTAEEEETLTITSGSFTNTVCDSNLPSTCEIVLDDSQVTLSSSSTCLVCDGDSSLGVATPSPLLSSPSPTPLLEPTPTPTFSYYGSTNPAATFSPLYAGGTLNPSYVTTTMMTMSPTASPTQAPTPVPAPVEDPVAACGAYIYTCEALKRAVEYERVNRTDACGFNLAINMTCGSSITIPSGIEIEINGLLPSERDEELNATTTTAADGDVSATARGRRLLPSGSVGGTNDSRSWLFAGNGCCGDEDDGDTAAAVDSLFVIESGGKLTLTNLGFQVATTNANMRNISVRAVYSSGELYVDGCDLVGPSSEDVNDRGGAIYSRGEVLSITSSSFCNFTAERSGGAVHVTDMVDGNGSVASVTIRSSSFAKNGALSLIPGSGGGAIAVMEGPVLEVTDCSFEDNYGRLGAAVLCSGGEFDGSVFVGGDSQTEEQGNGGLRSSGGPITVNNCSFVNVTSGTYDSVAPGSALQVLDSNLTVTETTFEGCTGTPLYMETNSPNGNPYFLQVESTVFSSNLDPGTNGTSGSAAEFNAANGTEIDNGGEEALNMTCEGNTPSDCEVVTATGATSLLFEIGIGCHVCDGEGVTAAGLDNSTGEITYTAESVDELKSLINSGLSGTFRLVGDISTEETITIVDGQTVTITSASSDGTPLYYSINPAAPFNGTNSAAAAAAASDNTSLVVANFDVVLAAVAADDGYGSESDSMFVVEPGASLTLSGLVLNATVLSSGVNSSDDDSNGLVRAVYNGGNVTVEDCTFVGTTLEGTNGGAIYNSLTATHLSVSDSSFYDLSVSSYGGAIYAAENTTVTITDTSFQQNDAGSSGGCVYAEWGTTLEVQGGSFQESTAPEGAAIAFCGGVLTGVTIANCTTTEETNGAVVSYGDDCPSDLDVSDAIFEDNSGGGLAGFETDVYVTGCNFTGNTGTAAYFETSDGFTITVEDVMFVNNTDATEWSTYASDEEGSDLVVLSISTSGIAEGSTAVLADVTCSTPASTCTVIIDEESFDLSTESVACGVCNVDGSAVNTTVADIASSSSGAWSASRVLAVVLPIMLALLLCCCCCLYYSRNGKQWTKKKKGRRHYLFRYPSMDQRWGPEETPRPPSSSSGSNSRPSSGARGEGDVEDVVAAAEAGLGDEYERMMLARAEAEAEVPDAEDIPPLVDADSTSMVVYMEGEEDPQEFDIDGRQVEASQMHLESAPPETVQGEKDDGHEVAVPVDSVSPSAPVMIAAAAAVGVATTVAVAASTTGGDDATPAGGDDIAEAEASAAGAHEAEVVVVTKTGAEEQPYVEDVEDGDESLVYHSTSASGGAGSAECLETKEVVTITTIKEASSAATAGVVPMTNLATGVMSDSSEAMSATSSAVLSSSSASSVGIGAAKTTAVPLATPTPVCMSTIPRAYPPAEAAMSQSSSEGSTDAGGAHGSGDGQEGGRILPQAHSFLPMEGEVEDLEEAHRTGEIHQ